MAASPKSNGVAKRKSVRVPGPRDVYIILTPGSDAAQVRSMIDKVTFNGRTVLKGIESGQPVPVVKMRMDVEPRGVAAAGATEAGTVSDLSAA